jgi:hypothetical protein
VFFLQAVEPSTLKVANFGKPENFTGAVGNFKFNVITSIELNASESLPS